jgi:hypothetical protein
LANADEWGRGTTARRRLRLLFHRGRVSLVIGLAFLAAALVANKLIGAVFEIVAIA